MDVSTITIVITTVSTACTAIIPLAAKWTAGKSEAVKEAALTRQSDIALLKELLQKCRQEKAELVKAMTENNKHGEHKA